MLYNSGTQEVTIPQLLIGYYDKDQSLIWVDHEFVQSNVRQQRKVPFGYDLKDLTENKILSKDTDYIFCNGKYQEQLDAKTELNAYIQIDSNMSLKLDVNNFIGNPK